MHVVVVGCGRVGSELARTIEAGGHTVAIIDKNQQAFRRLPTGFAGQLVVGFGFDRDVLAEAGIERADAVAAVTNGDNSNILTARIARETYEIEHVAARIYDPRRAVIYQRLGITTVAAVAWTTDQIVRRLMPGAHRPDWIDPSGKVGLVERDMPRAWAGKKLSAIEEPGHFQLVSVTRLGVSHMSTPDLVGQEGDILRFMTSIDAISDLDARINASEGVH